MFTEAGNIILGYKLKAHQVIHITILRPSMLRGKLFKLMEFEDFIKDWDLLFSRYVDVGEDDYLDGMCVSKRSSITFRWFHRSVSAMLYTSSANVLWASANVIHLLYTFTWAMM